jgi:tRNA 2-selenouridine synthase SelU
MSNPFSDLNKTLKDGQERWTKIEELATKLKSPEVTKLERHEGEMTVANLLVLLVEHLRPMYSYQDQPDLNGLLKKLLNDD